MDLLLVLSVLIFVFLVTMLTVSARLRYTKMSFGARLFACGIVMMVLPKALNSQIIQSALSLLLILFIALDVKKLTKNPKQKQPW